MVFYLIHFLWLWIPLYNILQSMMQSTIKHIAGYSLHFISPESLLIFYSCWDIQVYVLLPTIRTSHVDSLTSSSIFYHQSILKRMEFYLHFLFGQSHNFVLYWTSHHKCLLKSSQKFYSWIFSAHIIGFHNPWISHTKLCLL